MPRTKRLVPLDAAMHIICRGNNKQDIFNGDNDKLRYYSLLKELKEENNIDIFHYCLMNNHVHLIVWLSEKSRLSKFMKQVNLSYFIYFNKMYGHSGHLWQGRFRSNIINTDSYLLQCGKYIELNPVRAGIVRYPQGYTFSSYNHYAAGKLDPLVTNSPLYIDLCNNEAERKVHYVNFVVDERLINKELLSTQLFFGSEAFIRKLTEYYGIKNNRLKRGRPKKGDVSIFKV